MSAPPSDAVAEAVRAAVAAAPPLSDTQRETLAPLLAGADR